MAFSDKPLIGQLLASDKPPVYLLGISGPSSAGKTTLAYLLYSVFAPHVQLILHGDDFCRDIILIPTNNGYINADRPRSVDFEKLISTLNYVKASGDKPPESHKSWQSEVFPDQEARAFRMVSKDSMKEVD